MTPETVKKSEGEPAKKIRPTRRGKRKSKTARPLPAQPEGQSTPSDQMPQSVEVRQVDVGDLGDAISAPKPESAHDSADKPIAPKEGKTAGARKRRPKRIVRPPAEPREEPIAANETPGASDAAATEAQEETSTGRPAKRRGSRGGVRRSGRRRRSQRDPEDSAGLEPTVAEPAAVDRSADVPAQAVLDPAEGTRDVDTVDERAVSPTESDRGRQDQPRAPRRRQDDVAQGESAAPQRSTRKRSRPPAKTTTEKVEEGTEEDESPGPAAGAQRTMLINVSSGDECRIAVVHQGRLEELFIERASSQSHVGNIYKGRVVNVEPSIQAAFVDFGLPKNGFLHISDVQPQYFPDYAGEPEDVGRKIPRRNRPPIQESLRRGQEVIVQVIKEGVGTKGPTLTTYLSIPGRFLVMMPGMSRTGVSRKIEDDEDRRDMREMLNQLTLPPGIGFILRTAGLGRTKRDLQRDLNYLLRLWKNVVARVKNLTAPAELYQESDLVTRTIRDLYSSEYKRMIVDDAEAAAKAREFLQIAMPRSKATVELYTEREPLFHRFGIEEEIENINKREVPLRSGGSLVIESTEALVAIDVNSGRFRSVDDAEEMAFQLNTEAAEEIARQLRLRDLGGLIICDFIDMRLDRHKRAVERTLRDALKDHKERVRTLRMSAFGLIEMTRQRRGPSIKRNMYFECRHCRGAGLVKMAESVVLDVMRNIHLATARGQVQSVTVTVSSDVAYQILNRKRLLLSQIETDTGKDLVIRGDASFTSDQVEFVLEDSRGQPIPFGPRQQPRGRR